MMAKGLKWRKCTKKEFLWRMNRDILVWIDTLHDILCWRNRDMYRVIRAMYRYMLLSKFWKVPSMYRVIRRMYRYMLCWQFWIFAKSQYVSIQKEDVSAHIRNFPVMYRYIRGMSRFIAWVFCHFHLKSCATHMCTNWTPKLKIFWSFPLIFFPIPSLSTSFSNHTSLAFHFLSNSTHPIPKPNSMPNLYINTWFPTLKGDSIRLTIKFSDLSIPPFLLSTSILTFHLKLILEGYQVLHWNLIILEL